MDVSRIDCIIGIDPGANGGITVWRKDRVPESIKMPKDISRLKDWFLHIDDVSMPIVFIEKLSLRPDDMIVDDGKPNMGKLYRIQNMMQNFEHLKAVMEFCGIPYVLVHPMTWQSKLKLRKQGEEKKQRKLRYKEVAEKLYPAIKTTLWNCDATLIMHFGRYALANELSWVEQNMPRKECLL